jgi:hypothetical protein
MPYMLKLSSNKKIKFVRYALCDCQKSDGAPDLDRYVYTLIPDRASFVDELLKVKKI